MAEHDRLNNATRSDQFIKAEIKLYYDLYVPPAAGGDPPPLLIAVHGYGAHKRYMMREAAAVAPDHFVIASIEGPHQHFRQTEGGLKVGFGWLTDHRSAESIALHHRFVLDLISVLASEKTIDPSRVFLFGFSQACALNFRFAFTYPDAASAIVAIAGGIPGDLETNPSYGAPAAATLYLYGNDDEFYSNERFVEFDQKLRSRLPNFSSRQFTAKHEITDEMREVVREFLRDK
ncbi:MAG: PHB depolymerase family esterase [Acidobacteriota bacterium]